MVRRGTNEVIDNQVVESQEQAAGRQRSPDTAREGRLSLCDRQHAHRDERTILATLVFLSVWATGHIPRHRGHISHLGHSKPLRRRRRHQRRRNQPNDRKDREQMTNKSAKVHALTSHNKGNFESRNHITCSQRTTKRPRSRLNTMHFVTILGVLWFVANM